MQGAEKMTEHDLLTQIGEALLNGDPEGAEDAVRIALDGGVAAPEILATLRQTMDVVGQKYDCHEFYLPDLVLSGVAAKGVLELILPRLGAAGTNFIGTVVIGTVEGDIHDLGKTIVLTMLNSAGFRVYDLGTDVPASAFVAKAIEVGADIVAASALLSTTTPRLKDIEAAMAGAGLKGRVKTMVGGAAVTPNYARLIGADGYGKDAYDAVAVARSLLG